MRPRYELRQDADGLWSVLLINKDPNRSFDADLVFRNGGSEGARSFTGNVDVYQYSRKQYELGGPANNPYPMPFLMSSDAAARKIAAIIGRGKSFAVIPWQMAASISPCVFMAALQRAPGLARRLGRVLAHAPHATTEASALPEVTISSTG